MITVEHINKTFQVARRNAGFSEALHSLFHRQTETVHALTDLSFTIQDGEMVGYIGPNGAGKSSTIKILSGILTPDSGIYRVPQAQYRETLEELITLLSLEEIIRTPARMLSLGQRMRCEIAASLLHSPSLLFLDEPTIGLDAVSKLAVRDFIVTLNARHKTTVLITTHDMQDIEALAKRVLLIGRGQLLLDGTLEDLKSHRPSPDSTLDEMAAALYRDYQI